MGESESDAKLEKHTAAEMATANSEKSRPTSPSRKVIGAKHRQEHDGRDDNGKTQLASALVGRGQPALPHLNVAVDVFQDDHRVVYDQSDR